MAWTVTTEGSQANKQYVVYTNTVTLGGTAATRYSDVIDFIPPGTDFTVLSNSAGVNLSGSASDQLYISDALAGTFTQLLGSLRDGALHTPTQGTSYRSIDNTIRPRNIDVDVTGQWAYYKLAVKHAAVESTGEIITFKVIVGKPTNG